MLIAVGRSVHAVMGRQNANRLLLVLALLAIAAGVWVAGRTERSAADRAFAENEAAHNMLIGMLDQETGVRGFVTTGIAQFLEPYDMGRTEFDSAVAAARNQAGGDRVELAAIAAQEALARRWQAYAATAVAQVEAGGGAYATLPAQALSGKRMMDAFRAANASFRAQRANERAKLLSRAGVVSLEVVGILALLFAILDYVFIERGQRQRVLRRRRRDEFVELMQVARSEEEAYELVRRHLDRVVPGGQTVVLNRNNSADRLEARTVLPAALPLRDGLRDALPTSCLAIRMARAHGRTPQESERLLRCDLCGAVPGRTTCVPSLVGGEVIGSMLVAHPRRLPARVMEELQGAVTASAPVIANLRNLELAELRAATDVLTGLANSRAVQDTLKRMVAQGARTSSPLGVVLFDLDHFKQINDTFGHEKGNDVLAAVGDTAENVIRGSDFVGRYGGEEFVVLLPDTDEPGALVVAENLRQAIAGLAVEGVGREVTASFGVAMMPWDGAEPSQLLRSADRALYAAKVGGRNQVQSPSRNPLERERAFGTLESSASL